MARRSYRNETTQSSVIQGIKDLENRPAWERFYDVYAGFLMAVARRKGVRPEEAEEILQQVMAEVAGKMEAFAYDRSKGSFRGWLSTVMQRRVVDHLRKRDRALKTVPLEEAPEAGVIDAEFERLVEEEWAESAKRVALDRLRGMVSVGQFQIFHASVIEGWSSGKIAKVYGVSLFSIYQAKSRLKRVFAPILKAAIEELNEPERLP